MRVMVDPFAACNVAWPGLAVPWAAAASHHRRDEIFICCPSAPARPEPGPAAIRRRACFAPTFLAPAAVGVLRPLGTQMSAASAGAPEAGTRRAPPGGQDDAGTTALTRAIHTGRSAREAVRLSGAFHSRASSA